MGASNYVGAMMLSAVVLFPVLLSGSPASFIDLPAAGAVCMGIAGAILFSATPGQTQKGKLHAIGQGAWLSGIVVALSGLIMVLTNLAEPRTVGPYLAVSLLSMFYGAAVRLFCSIFCLRQV